MACLVAAAAGPSLADTSLNCNAYAGAAVAHNQTNLAQKCGFSGGSWSSDFNAHVAWCRASSTKMADLTQQDGARRAALAQCAAKGKQDQQACQGFAQRAVIAAKAAASRKCGFGGRRWADDYGGHFSWCLAANSGARAAEDSARANQLQGCLDAQQTAADQSKKDSCGRYAGIAVSQQRENQSRQCNFSGPAWGADFFGHFNYCMSAGAPKAEAQNATRAEALAKNCMLKVCHTEDIVSPLPPFFKSVTSCRFVPKPAH